MKRPSILALIVAGLVLAGSLAAGAVVSGPMFEGNRASTRCEDVVMLRRAFEAYGFDTAVTEPHGFIDPVPAWCEDPLSWAAERGITIGTGFGTLDPIPTRAWAPELEQAVVDAAAEFTVDQYLLEEIIDCESSGRPDAVGGPNTDGTYNYGAGQQNGAYIAARFAALGYDWTTTWSNPTANTRVTAKLIADEGTAPYASSASCSTAY